MSCFSIYTPTPAAPRRRFHTTNSADVGYQTPRDMNSTKAYGALPRPRMA